jgi:two-component system response regulator RegX3
MKKILIVEDEITLSDSLEFAFKKEGFQTLASHDGEDALDSFKSFHPDLIILDLMLPKMSGEDVCREIRKLGEVPIIVLSAKDSETDKVVAFELGADDFVTKPFNLREVIARTRRLIRRTGHPASKGEKEMLSIGPLSLDAAKHEAKAGGQVLDLTPKEFLLLQLLMENAGRVMTPEIILDRIWGHDYYGSSKAVNVYIKKLRAKLCEHGGLIRNIRGVGYKLEVSHH